MNSSTLKGLLIHLAIIISIITLVITIYFYGFLPSTTNHGETITVPDLIDKNIGDMESELIERGLTFEVSDSVYTSKYPPLTIINQFPRPFSKVKEGRKIFLTVNRKAPPMVKLPEITDKSIRHIRAIFENLDIKINKLIPRPGPNQGLVLEIRYHDNPLSDFASIPKGASVDVVVSDGMLGNNVLLPDLFGFPLDEADFMLKGLNLNLVDPLKIPAGVDTTGQDIFVIHQDPLPGTKLQLGEWVKLWIDIKIDSVYYRQRPDSLRADIRMDEL